MRYPGRGNFIVMQVIPAGPGRTLETYDYFFETAQPSPAEGVQRGMATPGFTQGRIVYDGSGSSRPEHAVHHFHGVILDSHAGR